MKLRILNLHLWASLFLVGTVGSIAAADRVKFESDIAPIFRAHCAGCHSAEEPEGGFAVDSAEALRKGGSSGVAITAGTASSSRLWLMVSGKLEPKMPPEDETPLSEKQLSLIETWIEQGAQMPHDEAAPMRQLRTPQIEPMSAAAKPVTAMAMTSDGSIRAIARFGSIELLDANQSEIGTITGDLGKVNSLQFDREGTKLLAATGTTGAFGLAVVFDVGTQQRVLELAGHRDILYAAEFSPDQRLIATAGYDRKIILWDAETGTQLRTLRGHNGAIFDLAFSPDGRVLVSACADETAKVWSVESGERLDTLGQSEGEVFAVDVTPDGAHIIAASADNRLRVWRLVSINESKINPLLVTRFVDESPLVNFRIAPDGEFLVVLSQSGNVKIIRTRDWNQAASLDPLNEMATDVIVSSSGQAVEISLMNGEVVHRPLPPLESDVSTARQGFQPVYMDLGKPTEVNEDALRQQQSEEVLSVGRGVQISGVISADDETDQYQWSARKGEVWAIDADALADSPIDTAIAIYDSAGLPVLNTRLQAVRESYFTFRGKNSSQTNDFRMFNWQLMNLNDYLYASGEVTKLFTHPRGPDSGFNVYPDEGNRWTYFGTSHRAHALGEPAYVVRPLAEGEDPVANGLPIFNIYFENDDDPLRLAGTNSRLLFTAPKEDAYTIRIRDTRGQGGSNYAYRLTARAAQPGFRPHFEQPNHKLLRGTGRDFKVRVDRLDGFTGPVTFEIDGLTPGVLSNSPITIEPGHRFALANIWADETAEAWQESPTVTVTAHALVSGRYVERKVGVIDKLELLDRPKAIPSIHPIDREVPENQAWTLQVRRGETATARILVRRQDGFKNEIRFGNEQSGRNTAHGVYVDNIGLSGLLVRAEENEREFFLTADPIAKPGKRRFHLQGRVDGNVTTFPIWVEVLP